MNSQKILSDGLLIGCVVFFIYSLALKWGWIQYYEQYRKQWMPERCDFCLSFWLSLLITTVALLLFGTNFLSAIVSVVIFRLLGYARN